MSRKEPNDDAFDPGATLCGHGTRAQRVHYLGGGLWVCFECLAKLLLGPSRTRQPDPSDSERPKRLTGRKP